MEEEVHPDLIRELLATIRALAKEDELEQDEWLDRTIRKEIARARHGRSVAGPGDCQVQCLVGPTGVGKTTTIAKLAANYALLAGRGSP